MFTNLIRFCLANRLLVFLFTALMVVAGIWAGSACPRRCLP